MSPSDPGIQGGPHHTHLSRGHEALRRGHTVIVTGPWGSGRTHTSRLLAAATTPPVPTVDDVHLLTDDEAARLAGRIDQARAGVPLVMTAAHGHRLAPSLRRALTRAETVVVELSPWSAGEVEAFVAARTGVMLDPDAADRLRRWSGGLPALLVAMVEDLVDGAAPPQPRAAGVSVSGAILPGPALRTRVDGLMDELDLRARRVLTTLMCTGPVPVTLADVALATRAVDSLQARGILVERAEGDVADLVPAADVLWQAVTAWVTTRRRRDLRRALAARVEAGSLARLSLHQRLQVARWAADGDGDVALVRQGVRPAMLVGDPSSAVELGKHVLARDPADTATRDLVVIAFEAMGDHTRATAMSAPAVPSDPQPTRAPIGSTALARHATNVYLATLDADSAQMVAPTVAPGAADDSGEAAALLGWMQLLMGDVDDACATSSPVLEDPASSAQARVWAGLDLAVGDVLRGGGPACLDLLDLSRRIAVTQPIGLTPYSEFQVATSRCVALVRLGRGDQALPDAETGGAATTDTQLRAAWHGVAGLAARETGQFERGLQHFAAIGDTLSGDPYGLGTWAASESAVCAFMTGSPALPGPAAATPIGLTEALLARNTAWCLAPGDRAGAAELALSSAEIARGRGQSTNEVLALVDAARWGRAATAVTALAAITRIDNPMIRIGGTVITALLRQRPPELIEAARAAALVDWWVVREELLTLARSRLVVDGRPTAAARLELCLRAQRWPTPVLLADDTTRYVTPREAEIGRQAVGGVPSAAIADRLSVSRRTVDNLLGRLYAKCGVTGRRMLADVVGALQ